MLFPLLGQQVPLCDFQLLLVGVAAQLDDLHAVQQRSGDGVGGVCGGDKENFGKVKGELQEIVPEAAVLFPVQGLQQRGGGVAPVVGAQLVDLVQDHQGVAAFGLDHPVDDAAGHRADVGLSVATDLRLVMDAAQRDAHQLAVGGPGDAHGDAGLAGARRAYKADEAALDLR